MVWCCWKDGLSCGRRTHKTTRVILSIIIRNLITSSMFTPKLTRLRTHRRVHLLLVYLRLQLAHQVKELRHSLLDLGEHRLNGHVSCTEITILVCIDINTLTHLRFSNWFYCWLLRHFKRRSGNVESRGFRSFKWWAFKHLVHLSWTWSCLLNNSHHFLNSSFNVILQFVEFLCYFVFEPDVLQLDLMKKLYWLLTCFCSWPSSWRKSPCL